MACDEDEYLLISGLQHFTYCRRQWALIHIEHLWAENVLTVEGKLLHERAHDSSLRECRGDVVIVRGMKVFSAELGITGECDVVEFHRSSDGVPLQGLEGKYIPFPIEYKRGEPRIDHANELQLCAQTMCLEEMLCCDIQEGALYFGQTRHRERVSFTEELRCEVKNALAEMHQFYQRKHTPKVKPNKGCRSCSLNEYCLPKMMKKKSVASYLKEHLED